MNILLLLLVLTSSAQAAWYEGGTDPKLLGGGGGNAQAETKQRISVQRLAVPTNPPIHNPNISIGLNQNRIEVVNLRGHIEAQNIDMGSNRRWWQCISDALGRLCSSMCGSRARPLTPTRLPTPTRLTPPPLRRTDSYYPGR